MKKNDPVVTCTDLEIRREAVPVLSIPSWSVLPGERWVVLGANGCGKTSLVLSVLGRLPPWDGRIEVLGLRAGRDAILPLRTKVAFSGDALDPLVDPSISCQELASTGFVGSLGIKFDRPSKAQVARARRELRDWGLAGFEKRPLGRLSMGQRRRAWLARALAPRPQLLVLDEPCAGLDPCAREDLVAHLDRLALRRPELPMVLVTHHLEEIPARFTHALLLKDGEIFAQGPLGRVLTRRRLSELYDRPVSVLRRGGRLRMLL